MLLFSSFQSVWCGAIESQANWLAATDTFCGSCEDFPARIIDFAPLVLKIYANEQHQTSTEDVLRTIDTTLGSRLSIYIQTIEVFVFSYSMSGEIQSFLGNKWKLFDIWHSIGADKTNLFVCVAPFEFIVLLLVGTSTKKGRSEPVTWQSYLYLDSRKFLFFSNQSLRGLFVYLHLLSSPCWLLPSHGHFATN